MSSLDRRAKITSAVLGTFKLNLVALGQCPTVSNLPWRVNKVPTTEEVARTNAMPTSEANPGVYYSVLTENYTLLFSIPSELNEPSVASTVCSKVGLFDNVYSFLSWPTMPAVQASSGINNMPKEATAVENGASNVASGSLFGTWCTQHDVPAFMIISEMLME